MIKQEFEAMDQCCNCFTSECICMDKENVSQQDISLYSNASPQRKTIPRSRRPLTHHDSNSQDSGYNASSSETSLKFFEFAKSLGVTPCGDCSPLKTMSFSSMDSMDEEFFDLADIGEPLVNNAELPADFNTLINGVLVPQKTETITPELDVHVRPLLRRSVSLNVTPASSKVRSCLFKNEDTENKSFKRPDPPMELDSPVQMNKRTKIHNNTPRLFQRSFSATEESIKYALQKSSTEPDLIGDFSRCYCLPLISGRHPDLKCISSKTLASVVRGEHVDSIGTCTVIDCRYPYEYAGGHIIGATNLYTKEKIISMMGSPGSPPAANQNKRNILVFHCEFSSERGPTLYRFLRTLDRNYNKDYYPALNYPELYLLEGGYKGFYESFPDLCEPSSYIPMLHPAHHDELRHFKSKAKSYNERTIGGRGLSLMRSSFI